MLRAVQANRAVCNGRRSSVPRLLGRALHHYPAHTSATSDVFNATKAPYHRSCTLLAGRRRTVAAMATSSADTRTVLVPVANGTEEMEAVIIIDVLRRAGASVTVASVEPGLEVTCSRGVKLVADALIGACEQRAFDLIACPGGMPGAERLRDSAPLERLVKAQAAASKPYAAICATPAVFFEAKGLLEGKKATAHPAFSDKLTDKSEVSSRVVVDGLLTTSRGPGTAFEFALSLVKQLYGPQKAAEVAGPMVLPDSMKLV